MATYTYAQLQDLWKSVGGSAVIAPFAAAVALAESGGNSAASNRNSNGSEDRGLWQINTIHGKLSTFDPVENARSAVSISKNGSDWRPWCVAWSNGHCGGTFLGSTSPVFKYIPASLVSLMGLSVPGGTATVGGTPTSTQAQQTSLPNPFSVVSPEAWLRPIFISFWFGVIGFIGFVAMVVGVVILVSESRAAGVVRGLGGKALSAAPQTRAVGAAVEASESGKEGDESGGETEGTGEAQSTSDSKQKERDPNDLGY